MSHIKIKDCRMLIGVWHKNRSSIFSRGEFITVHSIEGAVQYQNENPKHALQYSSNNAYILITLKECLSLHK